jgi:hypothetical protein
MSRKIIQPEAIIIKEKRKKERQNINPTTSVRHAVKIKCVYRICALTMTLMGGREDTDRATSRSQWTPHA